MRGLIKLWLLPWLVLLCCVIWNMEGVQSRGFNEDLPNLRWTMLHRFNSFKQRGYKTVITSKQRWFNPDDYSIFKNYSLYEDASLASMVSYSPPEIIQKLCSTLVRQNSSMMLFLQDELGDNYIPEEYILRMTAFLGIPVLAYAGTVYPSPQSSVLQLTPSIRHQCQAMLKLLSRYKWTEFSIITGFLPGDNYFVETLRELVETSKDSYEILSVLQTHSMETRKLDKQLQMLKKSDSRIILLYATEEQAQAIFARAKEQKLCTKEYVWIVSKSVLGNQIKNQEEEWDAPSEFPVGLLALNYGMIDPEDRDTKKKKVPTATLR